MNKYLTKKRTETANKYAQCRSLSPEWLQWKSEKCQMLEHPKHFCTDGESVNWCNNFWKTIWQHLLKLNICIPYEPEMVNHLIYPKKMHTDVQQKIYTRKFTGTLLVTVKYWKLSKCPTTVKHIKFKTFAQWTVLTNEIEWTTDPCSNIDESHKHNIWQKKTLPKLHTV